MTTIPRLGHCPQVSRRFALNPLTVLILKTWP